MKTKFEVIIGADRDTVWQAFDNPDNMVKWQPTLKSFTHKSGPRGEIGSVAELVYEENGREIVMTETMTEKRKPDFMVGIYESKWGKTLIVNYFESAEGNKTRWVGHANHSFKGFMKLMSLFIHKSICKRTESDMQRFKLLVESQIAAKNS
jgi:uncharacterized protein YndB with AHSA1/START domain